MNHQQIRQRIDLVARSTPNLREYALVHHDGQRAVEIALQGHVQCTQESAMHVR